MLSLEDDTMLADFAKAEAAEPSPRKISSGSRSIYKSRPFRPPTADSYVCQCYVTLARQELAGYMSPARSSNRRSTGRPRSSSRCPGGPLSTFGTWDA